MLAKLVMVGILALLCLTALVVTRASYAGHSVPAHPSTSLQQHCPAVFCLLRFFLQRFSQHRPSELNLTRPVHWQSPAKAPKNRQAGSYDELP